MDAHLHAALAAIDTAAAAHCAAHLVREHGDTARRLRVAVWADRIREGGR